MALSHDRGRLVRGRGQTRAVTELTEHGRAAVRGRSLPYRVRRSGGRAVTERQRSAPQGPVGGRAAFVVAQARLVVGEEDLADQVAAATHPRLVEHALEMLLDRVG